MQTNLSTPIRLREDGITALNLQDIYLLLGRQIRVIDFSPYVESNSTGADWEWWFLGQQSVFGAAVQAKCLSSSNDYDIGYIPKNGYPQIERLLDYSVANSISPMYCFYNWWNLTAIPKKWPCSRYPQQEQLWGCALADGWSIYHQHLLKQYSASSIAPICEPWHCIVCCDPVSKDPSERAKGVTRRLTSHQTPDQKIKPYKQQNIQEPRTHKELPRRITKAVQLAQEGNVRQAALEMGEYAPKQLLLLGNIQRYF